MPIARPFIAATLGLVVFADAASAAAYQHFWSRPDLKPPVVQILRRARHTAPGFLFLGPKRDTPQAGPMILDNRGRLVWFRPLDTRGISDFRMQWYRGRPVVTWWQARPTGMKEGRAYYVIADARYRNVTIVRPGYGLPGDIHEFLLTRRGTALMTTVHSVHSEGRRVTEGGVQELDLRSGRVLLDWHSIPHIPLSESYSKPPRNHDLSFDYFHVNAIDVDTDGNLLVSARNTHAVYKLNRRTGHIMWRLGGKRSDFALGRGVRFAWQHDARRQPDGTIRIFDNGAAPRLHPQTRIIFVHLDRRTMRARLVRTIVHRPPIVAINQGNAQLLPGRPLPSLRPRRRLVPCIPVPVDRDARRPSRDRVSPRPGLRQLERRDEGRALADPQRPRRTRAQRCPERAEDGLRDLGTDPARAARRGARARRARAQPRTVATAAARVTT